jgi:3-oxoacyl-[acyl-carrier protein] reductase
MNTGSLSGRSVIITGASRGLGEAIACRFAAEGAQLKLVARSRHDLERVAAACRVAGAECSIHCVDVEVNSQVRQLARAVGPVDVLVNCAGIHGPIGSLIETNVDQWEHGLQANLMGTVYTCHAFIPGMVKKGRGSVINLSGGGATSPRANFSSYATAKAAVVTLTEAIAAEMVQTGVRVNAIAPGMMDTKLQDSVLEAGERSGDHHRMVLAMRSTGEGATPRDVPARLALFLASEESIGLTGKLISAVHDPWQIWDATRIENLAASAWYTIRRLDPFTIKQLTAEP